MKTQLERVGLLTLSKMAGKPVTRVDVLIKSQKDGKYELRIDSLIGATRGPLVPCRSISQGARLCIASSANTTLRTAMLDRRPSSDVDEPPPRQEWYHPFLFILGLFTIYCY